MNDEEIAVLRSLRNRNFPGGSSEGWAKAYRGDIGDISDADATAVANTWGYAFALRLEHNEGIGFQRIDAPKLDVVGGPARSIVREVAKARKEAAAIKVETGHDVLDPDWWRPVEAAASDHTTKRNRWVGGIILSGFISGASALTAALTVVDSSGSDVAVSASTLGVVALIGFAGLALCIRKHLGMRKEFNEVIKPKIDLLRRVLNVAEEELIAAVE